MNRVLVSGLGNASDMGLCDACDLNFSWLVHYPSILIWCDEICLPQNALKAQKSSNDSKNDLAINLFLDLADSANLIKAIDLSPLKEAGIDKVISATAARDSVALLEHDSEIQKGSEGVPGEITINGQGYCHAVQTSIYTSILNADLLDASCLFSDYERTYLEKLYAVKEYTHPKSSTATIFNEIFSL